MIKISRLADYAIIILHYLATHPGQRFSAAQVAEATQLGAPTASKIMKRLNEAELLNSVRGSNGGYELARLPNQISMMAMIAAIDGDLAVTQCADDQSACVHTQVCGVKRHWQLINQAIVGVLGNLTLADLCRPANEVPEFPVVFEGVS